MVHVRFINDQETVVTVPVRPDVDRWVLAVMPVKIKLELLRVFYCMGIYAIQYHRKTEENPLLHKPKSVPEHHVQERFFIPGFMCRMLSRRCLEAVTLPESYLPTHTR